MSTTPLSTPVLSQRLKHETDAQHQRMHALMERAQPFANRERYAGFVAIQYLFQRDVMYLFDDPRVRAVVDDLDCRGRVEAARADLLDLAAVVPDNSIATSAVKMPEALGWLYVSEGSTLGAAFLLKEAQQQLGLSAGFGARNLAAYPEGRARAWRRFVASLDGDALDTADHDAVLAGANAAYARFGALLQDQFGLQ
jgi:heme oxygenase (biliverdin-IX-beta and delta-forming)